MLCSCNVGRLMVAPTMSSSAAGGSTASLASLASLADAQHQRVQLNGFWHALLAAPSHRFSNWLDEVATTVLTDALPSNQRALQIPSYSDGP